MARSGFLEGLPYEGQFFVFFLFWFGCLIQIRGIEKLSFGLCDQGFFSLGAKLAGCEDV